MTNNNDRFEFVHELPSSVREQLCRASNLSKTWYELAVKHKKYHQDAIRKLEESDNPTEELLTDWGFSNLTIKNLFELLSKIPDLESMRLLEQFVRTQDRAILETQENRILSSLCPEVLASINKDLKIDSRNFNRSQPAQSDTPKVVVNQNDNESERGKIINVPQSAGAILPASQVQSVFQPTAGTSKINNRSSFSTSGVDLLEIPYERLEKITEKWSSSHILGKGSFGMVFQARLNHPGCKVTSAAIRKLENPDGLGSENFANQLRDLSSYDNDHIVSLLAYGSAPGVLCLVYELMTKGSLEEKLFSSKIVPLTWPQRCVIAKGVASGLHYLHIDRNTPHGNLKSSNILLDKNFQPKIGDLALPRICGEKNGEMVDRMRETRPYLPDEFFKNINLWTKLDVYCYGLVLFELATGCPVYNESRPTTSYLKKLIDDSEPEKIRFLGDIKIESETKNILKNLISIGKWCTNGIPKDLPTVDQVLDNVSRLQS